MNVVITEFIDRAGVELLRAAGAHVVAEEKLWQQPERLQGLIRGADALIVRNQTQVDRALLSAAAALRVVGRLGVGLDNIDLEACRERGIPVVFARGVNAPAVAEYVVAAMFSLVRPLLSACEAVRRGEWPRQRFTGRELGGKTLGLVGFGAVGQEVARRAQALGMVVQAYDPVIEPGSPRLAELGVRCAPFEEILATSDFVSLHVPLTPATRGMIGPAELQRMKPGAYLINTARGEIIDERALLAALRAGQLAGAALDVRASEPPPVGDELAALPNVVSTPHIAGLTVESQEQIAVRVAEDVLNVLRGARPSMTA